MFYNCYKHTAPIFIRPLVLIKQNFMKKKHSTRLENKQKKQTKSKKRKKPQKMQHVMNWMHKLIKPLQASSCFFFGPLGHANSGPTKTVWSMHV